MLRATHTHSPAYLQVTEGWGPSRARRGGRQTPGWLPLLLPPAPLKALNKQPGAYRLGHGEEDPRDSYPLTEGAEPPEPAPQPRADVPQLHSTPPGRGRAGDWCPTVAGPRGRGQPQVNDWPGLREKSLARFLTTARDRRLGSAPRPRPPLQKKTPGGGHAGSRLSRRERGCSLGGGIFYFFFSPSFLPFFGKHGGNRAQVEAELIFNKGLSTPGPSGIINSSE